MNRLAYYCSYCVDILPGLVDEHYYYSSRCLLSEIAKSSRGCSIVIYDEFLFKLLELLRFSNGVVAVAPFYC